MVSDMCSLWEKGKFDEARALHYRLEPLNASMFIETNPIPVKAALAMMADSVEHVISYWVVFQKFHSPALAGFAVLSHWLPFLLFSVAVGSLDQLTSLACAAGPDVVVLDPPDAVALRSRSRRGSAATRPLP